MVEAEDGPVTRQVVKVVHDDGHEQVEDQEGADDEEADEVGVGEVGAAATWVASIVGLKQMAGKMSSLHCKKLHARCTHIKHYEHFESSDY
jgi:hypothetical protein